jgi:peptidoglycan hydrolase-like protein with peptidoglycan-binding domain|tara:strand:+ start:2758 stop:3504 length:747 start_codon:yes stop_codon:yes gene_type:complete
MRFYEIKETSEEVIKKGPPYDPSQSSIVKKFQSELQRLGYFIGATGVDGKFGYRTARAVDSYKKDFNIQGTGNEITLDQIKAMSTQEPKPEQTQKVQGPGQKPSQPGSLEGTNVLSQNPSQRSIPRQNIIDALDKAAGQMGVKVQITPNGGRASRNATNNHPSGHAADIQIIKNGKLLTPGQAGSLYDQLIAILVKNASDKGIRPGIGGYSWGIHYDESPWRQDKASIAGRWGSGVDKGISMAQRAIG